MDDATITPGLQERRPAASDLAPAKRILVVLITAGLEARWMDTPERIKRLIGFASDCILEASKDDPQNEKCQR